MSCRESRARRSGSTPVYLMPSRAGAASSTSGASAGLKTRPRGTSRETPPDVYESDWVRVAAKPPYYLHEPTSFVCWNRPWIRARKRFVRASGVVDQQVRRSRRRTTTLQGPGDGPDAGDAPEDVLCRGWVGVARTTRGPALLLRAEGGERCVPPPWAYRLSLGRSSTLSQRARAAYAAPLAEWVGGRHGRHRRAAAAAANGSIGFQKRAGVGLSAAASCRRVLLPRITDWIFAAAPAGRISSSKAGSAGAAPRRFGRSASAARTRTCLARGPAASRAASARAAAALAPRPAAAPWGRFCGEALPSSFTSLKTPRMTFAAGPRGLIGGEPAGAGGAAGAGAPGNGAFGRAPPPPHLQRAWRGGRAGSRITFAAFERRVPQVLVTGMSPPRDLGPSRPAPPFLFHESCAARPTSATARRPALARRAHPRDEHLRAVSRKTSFLMTLESFERRVPQVRVTRMSPAARSRPVARPAAPTSLRGSCAARPTSATARRPARARWLLGHREVAGRGAAPVCSARSSGRSPVNTFLRGSGGVFLLPGDGRPRLVVLGIWQYFADQLPVVGYRLF